MLAAAENPIRPGDRGPAVSMLRTLLVRASGPDGEIPAPADADLFDHELEYAVRAFQQDRGLLADGVVGPQTALQLDGARWRIGELEEERKKLVINNLS